jgi:hypothetical protein
MDNQDDPLVGINFEIIMQQGGMITARVPTLAGNSLLEMKVCGVDQGGIWVECQALTDVVLRKLNESSLPTTPILFLPYSAIRFAFVGVERRSLSTEKLGI